MNERTGQQPFKVHNIVKDWLIAQGRLPFDWLDEDTETDGSA